jgi:hypothetical protein
MAIIQSKRLQTTKKNKPLARLWIATVIVLSLVIGYVGPSFITKPSTVAIVVIGIGLVVLFGAIIAGYYFFGMCLLIIAIPAEDYARRLIYNGKAYPHLDPVHLIVEALLACIIGGLILRAVFTRTYPPKRRLPWYPVLIAFYFLYLTIQIINPGVGNPASGAQGFIELGYYALIFFAIPFVIRDQRQARILLWITVVFAGISGGYGVFQHFYMPPWDKWELQRLEQVLQASGHTGYLFMGSSPRAFSTFGSYESFGGYEVTQIAFGWMLFWVSKRWYTKLIAFILTAAMVVGVLFTYSRTCWTGALFDVLLLSVLLLRVNWFQRVIVAISLVAVCAVGFLGLATIARTGLAQNNLLLQRIDQTTNGEGASTLEGRQTESQALIEYANHNLFGAGDGADLPAQNGASGPQVNGHAGADVFYYVLLFSIGYPGLIYFLLITGIGLVMGLRYFMTVRSPFIRALMAACIVVILALLLINWGEQFLFFDGVPPFFWFPLGLIYIAPRLDERWVEQQEAQQQVVSDDTVLLAAVPG